MGLFSFKPSVEALEDRRVLSTVVWQPALAGGGVPGTPAVLMAPGGGDPGASLAGGGVPGKSVSGGGVPGVSLAGGGVPGASLAGGGVPGVSLAGGGVPGRPVA
jgi:hypothetical protein